MDMLNIALVSLKKNLLPFILVSVRMFVVAWECLYTLYIHIIYISEDTRVRQNQMEA